jgi:hypothetical protein
VRQCDHIGVYVPLLLYSSAVQQRPPNCEDRQSGRVQISAALKRAGRRNIADKVRIGVWWTAAAILSKE